MNILTLNKSVFGGKTKITKRKRLTEKSIKSELVIPDTAVELSCEEMEYADGGFFLGVSISRSACVSLYNSAFSFADKHINQYGAFSVLNQAFPAAVASVTSIFNGAIQTVAAFLKAHPIIAIAAGLVIAGIAYVLAGMYVAGARGRGFRTGLEIGFFRIKGVCELV